MYVSIGIAGTAKNTGKTTTTSAIMRELNQRGVRIFLTSIGYDGENIDNITGLPKPKLRMEAGDYIATAQKCVQSGTAELEVLKTTDVSTPLGKVCLCRVLKSGLVVTAGPNKTSDVRKIRELFYSIGPGVYIFDGALNRIMPMAETDGLILATGAAKSTDINELIRECKLIGEVCDYPQIDDNGVLERLKLNKVSVFDEHFILKSVSTYASLLTTDDVQGFLNTDLATGDHIYIPNIISGRAAASLYDALIDAGLRLKIIFSDTIKIVVINDVDNLVQTINNAYAKGVFTGVSKRVPLLAITINPFYPEYRIESNSYKPALLDPIRMHQSFSQNISAPVYNTVKSGAQRLVDTIQTHMQPWSSSYMDF